MVQIQYTVNCHFVLFFAFCCIHVVSLIQIAQVWDIQQHFITKIDPDFPLLTLDVLVNKVFYKSHLVEFLNRFSPFNFAGRIRIFISESLVHMIQISQVIGIQKYFVTRFGLSYSLIYSHWSSIRRLEFMQKLKASGYEKDINF